MKMKKIIIILAVILCVVSVTALPVFADEEWVTVGEENIDSGEVRVNNKNGNEEWVTVAVENDYVETYSAKQYVVDDAGLLNQDEAASLQSYLASMSSELEFDIVVVTTNDMGGKSEVAYADDYYDYNGYGYGSGKDGCLLLVHMDANRGAYISTTGYGITAITDYGIEHLLDVTVPGLSNAEYYSAFMDFANEVKSLVVSARNGNIYDVYYNSNGDYVGEGYYYSSSGRRSQDFDPKNILLGAIAGFIIALIVVGILKKQLKSVRFKSNAADYYDSDSLKLNKAYDRFVGRAVTRTAKPKDNDTHGGGSSTHSGSSGTSHGGGGRSF